MRVIVPVTPTLHSSSVAEPDGAFDPAAYNSGTTYALGARVSDLTQHRVYESLQAANTGKPLPVYPATQTDWWIEVGMTNRYACLDLARNTQTNSGVSSQLNFTVIPNQRVNAIAVMGMDADSLRIEMRTGVGDTLVYSKEFDLRLRRVRNGYEYCFKPFDRQRSVVQFDLPPFSDCKINILLTKAFGYAKCGAVLVGNYAYLGDTQRNPVNDALNFSTIERDIYGTATLVPRRTLPKTSQRLIAPKDIVNDILDVRENLNAVPAVWSGLDDRGSHGFFEAMLILGVYKQFSINLAYPDHAEINLELEEI